MIEVPLYNIFMEKELARLKKVEASMSHQDTFRTAHT